MDSSLPLQISQSDCEISSNCGNKLFSHLATAIDERVAEHGRPIFGAKLILEDTKCSNFPLRLSDMLLQL